MSSQFYYSKIEIGLLKYVNFSHNSWLERRGAHGGTQFFSRFRTLLNHQQPPSACFFFQWLETKVKHQFCRAIFWSGNLTLEILACVMGEMSGVTKDFIKKMPYMNHRAFLGGVITKGRRYYQMTPKWTI